MFARRNGDSTRCTFCLPAKRGVSGVLAVRLLRMRRVKYFPTGKYTSRRLPLKLHFLNKHIHTPHGCEYARRGRQSNYAFLIPHYTRNFPTSSASPSILSLFFRAKSVTSCTARLICGRQRELFERYNGVTARTSFSDGENFIWKI